LPHDGIVDTGHKLRELSARQSDDAMVHRHWPADGSRLRIAEQDRVTIPERNLATASGNDAQPAQIHVNAKIVRPLSDIVRRMSVTVSPYLPGLQTEAGQSPHCDVGAAREIRDGIKRYPGHSALVQRPYGRASRPHMLGVCGTLGDIHSGVAHRFLDLV
jgi:hypothetical protein